MSEAATSAIGSKEVLRLCVNGRDREVLVKPYSTLLEVLREDLRLTGTKHGCETGECGACMVLIDGVPKLSCVVLPAQAEGSDVTTIEGVAQGSTGAGVTHSIKHLIDRQPGLADLCEHHLCRIFLRRGAVRASGHFPTFLRRRRRMMAAVPTSATAALAAPSAASLRSSLRAAMAWWPVMLSMRATKQVILS